MKWLLLILLSGSVWAEPPAASWQYRAEMLKSAWRTFGPGAPVATLAGQIHQESAWKLNAVSWAGAEGFAQFMPATAKDMAERFPGQCAPANPFSPQWAFTCRDLYLKSLIKAVSNNRTDECSEWAFGLRAYNGGGTWVRRDRKMALEQGADPDDWHQVALFNAGRNASAFRENKEYPERIFKLEKLYISWGDRMECHAI